MTLQGFANLRTAARRFPPMRIAVAGGNAPEIAEALGLLIAEGIVVEATLTGDVGAMARQFKGGRPQGVTLLAAAGPAACAQAAVEVVRSGAADVLMKGQVDSTSYLRAVVDRAAGLRAGGVLSNVTVAEMPSLGRLIAATDNGILPSPDLEQKRQIVLNTAPLFRGLGISPVRVAAVCATDKVSDAMPATRDAATLAAESRADNLPGFEIGGPMGYDVAVSADAARLKGLENMPAAGTADLLLFPNIDAANAVAKSWKFHGAAATGSIVLGARCPVLLNSRSDGATRRFNAVLLAAAVLAGRRE